MPSDFMNIWDGRFLYDKLLSSMTIQVSNGNRNGRI